MGTTADYGALRDGGDAGGAPTPSSATFLCMVGASVGMCWGLADAVCAIALRSPP